MSEKFKPYLYGSCIADCSKCEVIKECMEHFAKLRKASSSLTQQSKKEN